jgi:hypothetical protein
MPDLIASTLPGADQFIAWFGGWPTFHDAEVLDLSLRREGRSCLCVYAWRGTTDLDSSGYFVTDHHAVVSFWFECILDLELANFSAQNVIAGLACEKKGAGFRLTLYPSFGISGYIEAERIFVSFEPVDPGNVR